MTASDTIMALPGTAPPVDLSDLGVPGVRVAPRDLLARGGVSADGVARFRTDWEPFVTAGFRLHLVTPWPRDLPEIDHESGAWPRAWRRIGRELSESIGDLVTTWQIGNELNIWYFRAPLPDVTAVANYVAAFGEGVRSVTPAAQLGINGFGVDARAMDLFHSVYGPDAGLRLDFIGTDCYWGSWQPGGPEDWQTTVDRVAEAGRGVPVAICEIGYPSAGGVSKPDELLGFVGKLGYSSLDEVQRDPSRLLSAAPEPLAESLAALPPESWADDFEDSASHLLRKWRNSWGSGGQTPEKQADYFRESLAILQRDPRVAEIMLFLFRDLPRCWTCGREDCPLETTWGFTSLDGRRKPVFGTVRELLAAQSVRR
jgi:hypothetical protein